MLKRAHKGTFHKLSPKHLDRYVQEFAGRHNVRDLDTIDQMGQTAAGMGGKRLRYRELVADNGLPSGAGKSACCKVSECCDTILFKDKFALLSLLRWLDLQSPSPNGE